jgi:hypothetical protein
MTGRRPLASSTSWEDKIQNRKQDQPDGSKTTRLETDQPDLEGQESQLVARPSCW